MSRLLIARALTGAGLADDLLLILDLDEDQEDALNDLRTDLETAPG